MDKHDHNANNQEHSHAAGGESPSGLTGRQAFLFQQAMDSLEYAQSIFKQLAHENGLPEPCGSCSPQNPDSLINHKAMTDGPASVVLPKAAPSLHPGSFNPDATPPPKDAAQWEALERRSQTMDAAHVASPSAHPDAAASDNAEEPTALSGQFSTTDLCAEARRAKEHEHGWTRIKALWAASQSGKASVRAALDFMRLCGKARGLAPNNTQKGRCPHEETHGEM